MSRWIPAFVQELDAAESAAALASMPGHVRAELDRLSKAEDKPEKPKAPRWRITGIASTEHVDKQGDTIIQSGLDWRPFLESGYINDDHGRTADHVIGYPTAVRKLTLRDGNGGKPIPATAIEGYLFNIDRAEKLATLAKSMEGTERQMGFSVEGPPPKRSATNPKEIVAATITHVALTPWPVNPNALAVVTMAQLAKSFAKAMTAGDGVAEPGTEVPGETKPIIQQDLIGAGRRSGRKRISTRDALAQIMGAMAASANKPAGKQAAEGVGMDAQKFLKGRLAKMSPAEATKFAKEMGWEPEGDDDDEGMEKGDPGVDLDTLETLMKGLARMKGKPERTGSLDKSADALGGLAKSGGFDAGLLKSLFDDVRDVFDDSVRAGDAVESRLGEINEVAILNGTIATRLVKSVRALEAQIEGLTAQIAQATGRPAAPKAAVNARPVPRFANDAVPGDLAKSGGHAIQSMSPEVLKDALTKGARDAFAKGDNATGEILHNVVTKLSSPGSEFDAAEKAAVNKILKG